MVNLRKPNDRAEATKLIRGLNRQACENIGGEYVRLGNEDICVVNEEKLKDGAKYKKPTLDVVDLIGNSEY